MRIGLERNEAIAKRSDLPGVARAVQFLAAESFMASKKCGLYFISARILF